MMEQPSLILRQYVSDRLRGSDCNLTVGVKDEQIHAFPFPGIPANSNPKLSLEKPELVILPNCLIGWTIGLLIDWDIKSVSPDLRSESEYLSGQAYLIRQKIDTIEDIHELFSESLAYTYPIAFALNQNAKFIDLKPNIWIVSAYDRDGYILSYIR